MNRNQAVVSSSSECPVCHGTGIKLYQKKVEGYSFPLDYAGPCPRCKDWKLQYMTGEPPQFSNADLSKFGFDSYSRDMGNLRKIAEDFLKNYRELWEKSGKGLYLWSKTPGSGKTFLACCIGNSVMIKYGLRMRFITMPDYLAKVGDSYKRQQGDLDESVVYRECDLLICDDMGAQKSGEWQNQELFRLINERLNAGLITIFTSNMSPESLNVEQRTIDRIMKCSVVLQMPEESIRNKKAIQEQEDFLKAILE